jgi:hypothetical protein
MLMSLSFFCPVCIVLVCSSDICISTLLMHCCVSCLSSCRACYGVLRFVMESGAKGCEVIVSGKLRAQRAKSMKFKVWPAAAKCSSRRAAASIVHDQ